LISFDQSGKILNPNILEIIMDDNVVHLLMKKYERKEEEARAQANAYAVSYTKTLDAKHRVCYEIYESKAELWKEAGRLLRTARFSSTVD
jgi:hypothetical protein